MDKIIIEPVAVIHNGYGTKFAIPRQSGIAQEIMSEIVFEPPYRSADAIRGMEGFSHLWLIWGFSGAEKERTRLTVRPPRLGGNVRLGVFATRSPYRPNPIGLSAVRIEEIRQETERGPVIVVSGADMMNGTPIYDIKPYLAFSDSIADARGGFSDAVRGKGLKVVIPEELMERIPDADRETVTRLLEQDPRPAYHDLPERVYGFEYNGTHIGFCVRDGVLTVCEADR